jgi:hypothetical protein
LYFRVRLLGLTLRLRMTCWRVVAEVF